MEVVIGELFEALLKVGKCHDAVVVFFEQYFFFFFNISLDFRVPVGVFEILAFFDGSNSLRVEALELELSYYDEDVARV